MISTKNKKNILGTILIVGTAVGAVSLAILLKSLGFLIGGPVGGLVGVGISAGITYKWCKFIERKRWVVMLNGQESQCFPDWFQEPPSAEIEMSPLSTNKIHQSLGVESINSNDSVIEIVLNNDETLVTCELLEQSKEQENTMPRLSL